MPHLHGMSVKGRRPVASPYLFWQNIYSSDLAPPKEVCIAGPQGMCFEALWGKMKSKDYLRQEHYN